jgi:hypothetical protein
LIRSGSDEQAGFLTGSGTGTADFRAALHTWITGSCSLALFSADETGFSADRTCCLMERRLTQDQAGAGFADRRAIEQGSNVRQIAIKSTQGETVRDVLNAGNVAAGTAIYAVAQFIAQLGRHC